MNRMMRWVVPTLLCAAAALATFSERWDETTPTKQTFVRNLDTEIRNKVKRALRERLAADHYFIAYDATDADTVGYHKAVHFLDQSADPDTTAHGGILYSKAGDAYWRDTAANVIRLTSHGVLATTDTSVLYDSVVTDTITSFTISDLDGDSDIAYELVIYRIVSASSGELLFSAFQFNGDETYTYTKAGFSITDGAVSNYPPTPGNCFIIIEDEVTPPATGCYAIWYHMRISAVAGAPHVGTLSSSQMPVSAGGSGYTHTFLGVSWSDDTRPITSIHYDAVATPLSPGSRITLWRRR